MSTVSKAKSSGGFGRQGGLFNISYKKTFSFKKLGEKINNIVKNTVEDIAKQSARQTKVNIGKVRSPALSKYTKNRRSLGYGWNGERVTPTNSPKPLIQTGALKKSIKYNKSDNSLEMNHYGRFQNSGFTSILKTKYMKINYTSVPPRPFIAAPKGALLGMQDIASTEYLGTTKPMKMKGIKKRFSNRVNKAIKSKKSGWTKQPQF